MKYPHTLYFEFSPSADRDDVRKSGYFNLNNFCQKRLVITVKMDGSNCLMTSQKVAARNGYDANHTSFDYAKAIHSKISHLIPDNIILYGEWLYAKHSIHYTGCHALNGFFQLFAVFDKSSGMWLDWESVQHYAKILDFVTVPSFSPFESGDDIYLLKDYIIDMGDDCIRNGHHEGIVVRNADSFYNDQFKFNVAKYVRKDHVQTDEHWSKQPIIRNILLSSIIL